MTLGKDIGSPASTFSRWLCWSGDLILIGGKNWCLHLSSHHVAPSVLYIPTRRVPRQGSLAVLSKKPSCLIHKPVSLRCRKSNVTLWTPPNPIGDLPLLRWKLASAPATGASNAYVIALLGNPLLNHPFSIAWTMWKSNALGNEWVCCCAGVWHNRFALGNTKPPLSRGTSRAIYCLPTSLLP